MAAGEVLPGVADEHHGVAGDCELGRRASVDVGDVGDSSDHQRRRDGMSPAVAARVGVVERVLARHERCGERLGGLAAAGDGAGQGTQRRRVAGVAPREVVEQRHTVGIGADRHDVADRLVDGDLGHLGGVVQPVPRVDADADGDAVVVLRMGEHDAVGVPLVVGPGERSHERRPADLVVVAMDDRRLGGDVGVGEQGEQCGGRIVDAATASPATAGRWWRSWPPCGAADGRHGESGWEGRARARPASGRRDDRSR